MGFLAFYLSDDIIENGYYVSCQIKAFLERDQGVYPCLAYVQLRKLDSRASVVCDDDPLKIRTRSATFTLFKTPVIIHTQSGEQTRAKHKTVHPIPFYRELRGARFYRIEGLQNVIGRFLVYILVLKCAG